MTDPPSSKELQRLYAKKLAYLIKLHRSNPTPIRIMQSAMASSMTLTDPYGNPSGGSAYGSSGQSENGKSPLSRSLGFLKTLTEKKSTRGRTLNLPMPYAMLKRT